jgi:hypothetical protein
MCQAAIPGHSAWYIRYQINTLYLLHNPEVVTTRLFMRTSYLLFALLSAGLALLTRAQQADGYTISGQDARLTGQTIYLLPAERLRHTEPWTPLDSTKADARGQFVLRGRVPGPDVYRLRVGQQPIVQAVPLTGWPEQLTVQVEEASTSTRRLPTYWLRPSGTPAVALLQALQPYFSLCSSAVSAADPHLHSLAQLLRSQTASPWLLT